MSSSKVSRDLDLDLGEDIGNDNDASATPQIAMTIDVDEGQGQGDGEGEGEGEDEPFYHEEDAEAEAEEGAEHTDFLDEYEHKALSTLPFPFSATPSTSSRRGTAGRLNTASTIPVTYTERPSSHEVQLLYKGRKYNWQAKVNLHVHFINHDYADCIEIIAFNTSNFIEAEHIYVAASAIFQRVDDPLNSETVEMVMAEYGKLHLVSPPYGLILQGLLNYKAAMFLLDRLTVSLKHTFSVDVKEVDQSLKTSNSLGNPQSLNTIQKRKDEPTNEGVSMLIRKPEVVIPCSIRRYGKSSTLVGDVAGTQLTKDEEILQKLIANMNSPTMANQAHRIISRISLIHKTKKRNNAIVGLKSFAKFRNDNDLLQESLSFLHISDFFILQCVCKRWRTVLGYAIRATTSFWISSRDFYLTEEFFRRKLKSKLSDLNSGLKSAEDKYFYGSMSKYLRPRDIFLSSDTVIRILRAAKNVSELTLHYVIFDSDLLSALQTMPGRLKKLSLGIIKVNDAKQSKEANGEEEFPLSPSVPGTPKAMLPAPTSHRKLNSARSSNANHRRMSSSGGENYKPQSPHSRVHSPQVHTKASNLRYLRSSDVQQILQACGMELTHLELSFTIGDLEPKIFHYTPKLHTFAIFNSHLTPRVQSVHNDLEGSVAFSEFVHTFSGIPISDLLVYVSDSPRESFLITDKRGRIVTANDAWEQMFNYPRTEIFGKTLDFLGGYMTDSEEYERIIEGIKTQIKPVEVTVFLHQADGTPFLTQVIMIPNCSKFRGEPLPQDCLTQDFMGKLALEQEEMTTMGVLGVSSRDFKSQSKTKMDWRITNKEISYHVIRFGLICEAFLPYETHIVTDHSRK